jgi:molybdopterin molybdotransferase
MPMITAAQALETVLNQALSLPKISVPLTEAVGQVLREDLLADRDFPPFDRVTMDGIAIMHRAWEQGQQTFMVEEIQLAGQPRKQLLEPTACLEVMTGAVLPQGADTVIRYEDVELFEEGSNRFARVKERPKQAGQNVHRRGSDQREGDLLVRAGTRLGPAEIAVAATVGRDPLQVSRPPVLAVVSTGDELVEITQKPLPHQIRMSNVYMLQAALRQAGARAERFHLPDHKEGIARELERLLGQFDAVLLSGGVSMGKADYVPEVLAELGVQKLFHQVAQRPGKPFWFGRSPEGKVVFALPGNPVSTFVCYYKYVRPWLQASFTQQAELAPAKAALAAAVTFGPDLTYFLSVRTEMANDGRLLAHPVRSGGSGDFASLLHCDGFLELPQHQRDFKAGEVFPLLRFRQE